MMTFARGGSLVKGKSVGAIVSSAWPSVFGLAVVLVATAVFLLAPCTGFAFVEDKIHSFLPLRAGDVYLQSSLLGV